MIVDVVKYSLSNASFSIHEIFTDLKMATSYQIGFMKGGKIHPEVVEETKSCMYTLQYTHHTGTATSLLSHHHRSVTYYKIVF